MTGKVVTAVKYKSTVNQKKPKDLMVGEMAKNMIADKDSINLCDSKAEEYYNVIVEFYKAGLDYLLVKMPYNDEILDKAQVADVSMQTQVSVSDLMYFVDKFSVLLPSRCTKDALELEFVSYQTSESIS